MTITTAATELHELHELRRRAWRERGIITIEVDAIENAWERQVVVNVGDRLYGARGAPEGHADAREGLPRCPDASRRLNARHHACGGAAVGHLARERRFPGVQGPGNA